MEKRELQANRSLSPNYSKDLPAQLEIISMGIRCLKEPDGALLHQK